MCKAIWVVVVGEELPCRHENHLNGNRFDPFTVAVIRGTAVVGSCRIWKDIQRLEPTIETSQPTRAYLSKFRT